MKKILIPILLIPLLLLSACKKDVAKNPTGYKNIKWNMSKEEVINFENEDYKCKDTETELVYSVIDLDSPFIAWSLAGGELIKITYIFKNNKLIKLSYMLEDDKIDKDVAESVYNKLVNELGEPTRKFWIHYLNDDVNSQPMVAFASFETDYSKIEYSSYLHNIGNNLELTYYPS